MKQTKTNNPKDLMVRNCQHYYTLVLLTKLSSAFNSIVSFPLNVFSHPAKTSIGLFQQLVLLQYVSKRLQ
jgi:hypothetical protein